MPFLYQLSQFPEKASGQFNHKRKLPNHHLQEKIIGNTRVQCSTHTDTTLLVLEFNNNNFENNFNKHGKGDKKKRTDKYSFLCHSPQLNQTQYGS